ncbi:hypothetical protein TanjilG_32563 [Lupinus angustifolius]|uniref:Fe2OG dioxygenase domain-containing protein n=1 Tax=Lupinus angustifolius TaxID=3871 RepID=A0A4P1R7V9_LUPAN|nr:PREDICTED: gibberellin 2-beta-dioxygenase 8 [Lupinus angustifolius]OIW04371.1 hypothetical protein TanjilG_32563 [Lupinus angustifolius]
MNDLNTLPPVLRHLCHEQPPTIAVDDGGNLTQNLDPIPVVDLQSLNHDKNNLDEACKDWGLFRLVNHGIPPTLLNQLHDQAKQVFSLSFESKRESFDGSSVNHFWGTPALTSSGTGVTSDHQKTNLFEAFHVPLAQLSQFQPQLPLIESFRVLLVEYGNHLSRIATTLFEAMVKKLELNLEPSKSYLAKDTGYVRVYRYPHCSNPDIGLGMEVHTDSSVLTILNQQDIVSGLEVLRDNQWLTINPISNTLIVNIGDLMQALSDDRYKSVVHRVKVNREKERISMGYFVFSGDGVELKSSKYKPFTYDHFRDQVQQDVKAFGTKIGLARFKRAEDN